MNKKNIITKNSFIELCRFVSSYIIFSFHANSLFVSGWIFVEYFFILSGYFAIRHLSEKKDSAINTAEFPLRYTINKFKRLFPYTSVEIILNAFLTIYMFHLRGLDIIKWLLYLPVSLLLLPGTGIMPYGTALTEHLATPHMIAEELWYLSALLVALPVMLYLFIHFKERYSYWLVSFFPLLLHGFLIIRDGTIHGWHEQSMTFFSLDIRALAGLLIGGSVYYVSLWWKKFTYTPFGTGLLTLTELGCFLSVVIISSKTSLPYDALEILLFLLSLSLTFSGKTLTSRIQCRFFCFLGKLSLPVYCIHISVFNIMHNFQLPMSELNKTNFIFIIVVIFSIILYTIIEKGRPLFAHILDYLKAFIIVRKS